MKAGSQETHVACYSHSDRCLPGLALILQLLGKAFAQVDKENTLKETDDALGADVGSCLVGGRWEEMEGEGAGIRGVVNLNAEGQFDYL